MTKHEIPFEIYNEATLSRKRLELQFNFIIDKVEIYKGKRENPILCAKSGVGTKAIQFVFQSPIHSVEKNIGVYVEGNYSGSPRLERLIWITIGEFEQNKINQINSQYFP